MKKLTKILGAVVILATTASAGNFNLTKNLTLSAEKGLMDKQNITVVSASKSFNYLTLNASVSNKTFKDFSASVNLFSVPIQDYREIRLSGIYGYQIFNSRTTKTTTQKDQKILNDFDKKRYQVYLGVLETYIISKNMNLYDEIDIGTKTATLKLGMQHNLVKNIYVGAEVSRRWSYNSNYDTIQIM